MLLCWSIAEFSIVYAWIQPANWLSLDCIFFCCNSYLQFESQDSAPSVQTAGVNQGAVSDVEAAELFLCLLDLV